MTTNMFLLRIHIPIFSSVMTYDIIFSKFNTTGATSGEGTSSIFPSRFQWCSCFPIVFIFRAVFCRNSCVLNWTCTCLLKVWYRHFNKKNSGVIVLWTHTYPFRALVQSRVIKMSTFTTNPAYSVVIKNVMYNIFYLHEREVVMYNVSSREPMTLTII